jgi:hypothetical protein
MTTPTVTELVRNGNHVGKRVELARYTIPTGERVLHGQRVNGVVRVTDTPAGGRGRAYLVEREFEQDGNAALEAVVADYLLCRTRHSMYYADPLNMPTGGVIFLLSGRFGVSTVGIFGLSSSGAWHSFRVRSNWRCAVRNLVGCWLGQGAGSVRSSGSSP